MIKSPRGLFETLCKVQCPYYLEMDCVKAAWTLGSVVALLPSAQQVPSSIPDSGVGFFSSRELFYGMYGMAVCMFHCPFSIF